MISAKNSRPSEATNHDSTERKRNDPTHLMLLHVVLKEERNDRPRDEQLKGMF